MPTIRAALTTVVGHLQDLQSGQSQTMLDLNRNAEVTGQLHKSMEAVHRAQRNLREP